MIDVYKRESQDADEFNEYDFIDLIKQSNTYEELHVLCDINDIECIITREEYANFKAIYGTSIDVAELLFL